MQIAPLPNSTRQGGGKCPIYSVVGLWLSSPPPPQDLIVDQTIEKVSFCAPDRNFDKAFSYICRDGTTRRWICHGFLALKDSVSAGFPPCHKGGTLCFSSRPSAPEGGWP